MRTLPREAGPPPAPLASLVLRAGPQPRLHASRCARRDAPLASLVLRAGPQPRLHALRSAGNGWVEQRSGDRSDAVAASFVQR